jgi:hypothetical protein
MNCEPSPAPTDLEPATLGVTCAAARAETKVVRICAVARRAHRIRTGDEDGGSETHFEVDCGYLVEKEGVYNFEEAVGKK